MSNPSESAQSTYTPPESPSPNLQTTLLFVEALNEWNFSKVAPLFDDSLEHHVLPKSLGRPVLGKEEYLINFKKAMPLFKYFNVRRYVGSSAGESVSGSPYGNEYMLIIHFAPPKEGGDGLPKISKIKEFIDSARVLKFFEEERGKGAGEIADAVSQVIGGA
ncbi:hypothetical protein H0H81_010257 [Sphagnurus paluster]|uniref:SnoaL-like domain-containing protein n=1 Tax=Sphagnurus paluster TaxID=117069 RepID=A0A9P7KHW3_9AGAR|nr:hypothetical protein H0H81_010257 [Sphagnurus paluster]